MKYIMGSVVMKKQIVLLTFLATLCTTQAPVKAAEYADEVTAATVTVEELLHVLKELDPAVLQELDAKTLQQLEEIVAQAEMIKKSQAQQDMNEVMHEQSEKLKRTFIGIGITCAVLFASMFLFVKGKDWYDKRKHNNNNDEVRDPLL